MAILKKVKKPDDLVAGQRYLDLKHNCVVRMENYYPVSGLYEFIDIDDEECRFYVKFGEIVGTMRCFNLTDIELRALLCTSMIEFIELMILEKEKK